MNVDLKYALRRVFLWVLFVVRTSIREGSLNCRSGLRGCVCVLIWKKYVHAEVDHAYFGHHVYVIYIVGLCWLLRNKFT